MSDKVLKIVATKKIDDVEYSSEIEVDLGANIQDAISMFGEEVVYTNFLRASKIEAQAAMRRKLEAKATPEEVAEYMKNWKPGVQMERVSDPTAAITKKLQTMSQDEQDAFIEELRRKVQGNAKPEPAGVAD